MPNLELAIVESVSAFIVLLSFVIAAAALTLTLIESYLVIGGAVLLLGFGGSRWTASHRRRLFQLRNSSRNSAPFFLSRARHWRADRDTVAGCHSSRLAILSQPSARGGRHMDRRRKPIVTTVCSNTVPSPHDARISTAMSIVFLIVTLAVPYTAASIVSGTVGLALSHAFEAAYVAQTIIRPITSALQTGFNKVAQIGNGSGDGNGAKRPAGSRQWTSADRRSNSAISVQTADSECRHRRMFEAHRSCRRVLRTPRR